MNKSCFLVISYLLAADLASASESKETSDQKAPFVTAYVTNQWLWYEDQGAKPFDKAVIEISAYLNENFYAGARIGQNCCIGWHFSAETSHAMIKAYASLAFDQHNSSYNLSFIERRPSRSRSLSLGFRAKHLILGYIAWGETTFKSAKSPDIWNTVVQSNEADVVFFTGAFIGLGFSI